MKITLDRNTKLRIVIEALLTEEVVLLNVVDSPIYARDNKNSLI
jgi:hypothetical protein